MSWPCTTRRDGEINIGKTPQDPILPIGERRAMAFSVI